MNLKAVHNYSQSHPWLPVAVAGVAIGVAAWFLKWLVGVITSAVMGDMDITKTNFWLIIAGFFGIVLTVVMVKYIIRQPLEHSTEKIKQIIGPQGDGVISPTIMYAPILASSLTLGFGGSAGSEGPIAYTGAAIGSNMGRWFGLSRDQLVMCTACGAGAGIAAIFKSPVGGMFFTLEVLRMQIGLMPLLMLAAMCIISSMTAYLLSGQTPDMTLWTHPQMPLDKLPLILLLGLFCGLYGAYYYRTGQWTQQLFTRLKTKNIWLGAITSGLLLGVLLFLFPALYGEGYGILGKMANGDPREVISGSVMTLFTAHKYLLPLTLVGVMALKSIAAYASNSGGGVAGDFAPTLFAGGIAGLLFAQLTSMPVPLAVVCGMGAVMASATRAPLMAIFITVEMTTQQQLLLPVSIAAGLAYWLSSLILKKS
ncbi:MAG: chloride channel protein [Bacteroides sp.]|nr:chloride channel protein [Bacteroides sp.]MBD5373523.1 chloride channel protein [Bacteroides sp.]